MKFKFNQKWVAAALIFAVIVWFYTRKERAEGDSQPGAGFGGSGVGQINPEATLAQFQAQNPGIAALGAAAAAQAAAQAAAPKPPPRPPRVAAQNTSMMTGGRRGPAGFECRLI